MGLAYPRLMNLAYPYRSSFPPLPFFNNAFESGAVCSNLFAFKLASTGSSLFLGGTDPSLFLGSFETHNVDTRHGKYFFHPSVDMVFLIILFVGLWQIPGASAIVGNKIALTGFETMLVLALRGNLH